MESLIPIDSMIPPRAGAYNSLDTLQQKIYLIKKKMLNLESLMGIKPNT